MAKPGIRRQNSLAYISRRMKIVHVKREDQHLVQGAHYACACIAAEIKKGKVTLPYASPDPEHLPPMWIAACNDCVQAASWGEKKSEEPVSA